MVVVHHTRRVLPALAAVLAAAGCARPVAPPPPAPPPPSVPTVAALATTTSGAPELALADADGFAPGTLVGIHSASGNGSLKGLAVILDGAGGPPRARLTAVTDPTQPILPGDRVTPQAAEPAAAPAAAGMTEDPVLAALRAELEDARARLEADAGSRADSEALLAAMHAELQRLRQAAASAGATAAAPDPRSHLGSELARIEAERAYFALAAQVLRLAPTPEAVASLQTAVRTALAARADLAPETSHAP